MQKYFEHIVQAVIAGMWTVHPRPWAEWYADDWNLRPGIEIETVNYLKTEYTEGFGASGASLESWVLQMAALEATAGE